MTEEEAERQRALEPDPPIAAVDGPSLSLDAVRSSNHSDRLPRSPVEKTMEKAQKQADKSERKGASEQAMPDRTLGTVRSPSAERSHGQAGSTLPVVEEAGEAGSTGGRSGGSVGGNVAVEKERDILRDESQSGVRRVISGQQPTMEKADGFDDASVLRSLTASPAAMDPEKSLVDGLDKPEELGLRHTG
jgi:hypothetical protein